MATITDYLTQLQADKQTLIDNLVSKGVNATSEDTFTTLAPKVLDISGGGGSVPSSNITRKDVNFYDYDGSLLYAYTSDEFLALGQLPDNPTHSGLISEGWNWTLEGAKNHVTECKLLNIGQTYHTDDDTVRIYIDLPAKGATPTVGFGVQGTATIDWGDGSDPTIVTGTSLTTAIDSTHTYAKAGKFVISISSNNGIQIIGTSNYGTRLYYLSSSQTHLNRGYQFHPYKIVLASNTKLGSYAFSYCGASEILLPNTISPSAYCFKYAYNLRCAIVGYLSAPTDMFAQCTSLTMAILPENTAGIYTNTFNNCYVLTNFTIPYNATKIDGNGFSANYNIKYMYIPKAVVKLNSVCCQSLSGMIIYDFRNHEVVPSMSASNAFNNIIPNTKIVVPDSLYDEWIAASNWSNYASYIIKASEYDG